jgi:hypothetical protein
MQRGREAAPHAAIRGPAGAMLWGGASGHAVRISIAVRISATDWRVVAPACRMGDRCPPRGGPKETYAAYLHRLNDDADLSARHRGVRTECVSGALARGPVAQIPEPVAQSSLPRLGDVTPTNEVGVRIAIQQSYGVRSVLNRGILIDLMG